MATKIKTIPVLTGDVAKRFNEQADANFKLKGTIDFLEKAAKYNPIIKALQDQKAIFKCIKEGGSLKELAIERDIKFAQPLNTTPNNENS